MSNLKNNASVEEKIQPDLICPYCRQKQISLMEVNHDERGVMLEACCEDVDCRLKLVNGRHHWQIGVIRPIDYTNMHASGILDKDRKDMLQKFPSLKDILSNRKVR